MRDDDDEEEGGMEKKGEEKRKEGEGGAARGKRCKLSAVARECSFPFRCGAEPALAPPRSLTIAPKENAENFRAGKGSLLAGRSPASSFSFFVFDERQLS